MSLILCRLSKPQNDSLLRQKLWRWSSRLLSSSPPYFILGYPIAGGDTVWSISYTDGDLSISKKKVPYELLEPRAMIGASRGWVATLKKGMVCLHDDLNLGLSADSDPKRITLPPLVPLLHCQTKIVTNVAMSSSFPLKDDCVVAVKFLGPQLSLCRPRHDTKWTNIRIKDPSFFTSEVMFSQRDQMFSMPASGCDHLGSWDLLKHRDNPKFQKLRFQNLPVMPKKKRQVWDSCYRTEHLVESSAGETFLVIWYRPVTYGTEDDMVDETTGFRVFKVDEEGNATYTEDIGDCCIFLSKSEPFCLPASSFPGLERNYIYYLDPNEWSWDLEFGSFGLQNNTSNFSQHHTSKVPYIFPPHLI